MGFGELGVFVGGTGVSVGGSGVSVGGSGVSVGTSGVGVMPYKEWGWASAGTANAIAITTSNSGKANNKVLKMGLVLDIVKSS